MLYRCGLDGGLPPARPRHPRAGERGGASGPAPGGGVLERWLHRASGQPRVSARLRGPAALEVADDDVGALSMLCRLERQPIHEEVANVTREELSHLLDCSPAPATERCVGEAGFWR
jgi:hypothetical protein